MAPPPELLPDAAEALHCWHWCEGWNPDRLPLYAALYPVADWSVVLDLLQHIRAQVSQRAG